MKELITKNKEILNLQVCGKIDMTSGYFQPLTQAMIIYQATRVGRGVNRWAFNLHPDVRIYLNKAVKRGKIVVSRNGEYKWNL